MPFDGLPYDEGLLLSRDKTKFDYMIINSRNYIGTDLVIV